MGRERVWGYLCVEFSPPTQGTDTNTGTGRGTITGRGRGRPTSRSREEEGGVGEGESAVGQAARDFQVTTAFNRYARLIYDPSHAFGTIRS